MEIKFDYSEIKFKDDGRLKTSDNCRNQTGNYSACSKPSINVEDFLIVFLHILDRTMIII